MGWSVGYDSSWKRDIGYGVPATCDHPGCGAKIDRGLSHVCGGEPYGEPYGCGLYFCSQHLYVAGRRRGYKSVCKACQLGSRKKFEPTPDTREWLMHKLTHESWARWRSDNPKDVQALRLALET